MSAQHFVYPANLFQSGSESVERSWVCVRTRPQWEKKLARWMAAHRITHFLPVYERQTLSGRKHRTTLLPLFGGYVFVAGVATKTDLGHSESVITIVVPSCRYAAIQLNVELRNLWEGLIRGENPRPALYQDFKIGQKVLITSGPMMGVEGIFQSFGSRGRLVITVALLGGGVSVEVPDRCQIERIA